MTRRHAPLLCACLAAALCLPAAPAAADDASVRSAWDSTKTRFAKQQRGVNKAARRLALRGFKRPAPYYRALRRVRRTIDLTQSRVRPELPSTASGTSAKDYVVRSLRSYEDCYRLMRRAGGQVVAGKKRGFRTFTKAGRKLRQAKRQAKTARSLFEQAEGEPPVVPAPTA